MGHKFELAAGARSRVELLSDELVHTAVIRGEGI